MSDLPTPTLILGSSSRYRREMLARLRMPFEVCSPNVDETPCPGEGPALLAPRLALLKARAVADARRDDVIVIGSDQVAELDGQVIGKPHTHERAVAQLQAMSGRAITFHTAVAVVRPTTGYAVVETIPVHVRFRTLSQTEIEHYLRAETPYDCAGSAKSEGLGIALLEAIEAHDPTALVGLPLIRTSALLRDAGLDALSTIRPALTP